jgi:hypothetical protein
MKKNNGKEKGKLALAIILSVALFFVLNVSSLYLVAKQLFPSNDNVFLISLCNVERSSGSPQVEDLAKQFVRDRTYVPDYYAEIDASVEDTSATESPQISIRVIDKSPLKETQLNRPYFYILLFNPSGVLEAVFPCGCFYRETSNIELGYSNYYSDLINWRLHDKSLSPWSNAACNRYTEGKVVETRDCPRDFFNLNESCFPREFFINGGNQNGKIVYTYETGGKVGTWHAYIFLMDENYFNRELGALRNMPLRSNNDKYLKNAVAYKELVFDVKNKAPSQKEELPVTWIMLSLATSFIIAIGSYIGNWYNFVDKSLSKTLNWCKENKGIVIFILIMLLVIISGAYIIILTECSVKCLP